MNKMETQTGGLAANLQGPNDDDDDENVEMIQRELCLLSLVESAEIKLRRQQERLIELERAKRAGQMRASQPSETPLHGEGEEAIHGIVHASEQAPKSGRQLAASIGWQLKSPAFVTLNELGLDREQPDERTTTTTKRQQPSREHEGQGEEDEEQEEYEEEEEAIETSGRLRDEARLVGEMTNRAGKQQQQPPPPPLAQLPMNGRQAKPILSNANEFSSQAAQRRRRRASLRLEMTLAALERDKDKIDGRESERRPSVAAPAPAPVELPEQTRAGEHTKLNHQRNNCDHQQSEQQQQQQQRQLALMLQKSDQHSLQNDRTSGDRGACEDLEGQRPPPLPTSFSAQSSNDGRRALALTSTGSEFHCQNSKHPEHAHYDMNDCYVVGGQGHEHQPGSNHRLQEEDEGAAHLESAESRRRSIKRGEQVDDERGGGGGGGPTPTNDLIRTLLERDRHALGMPQTPRAPTANGPGLDQLHAHRRRWSSQVNNNEMDLRWSDKPAAHHEESDDDESNFDKSGHQGQSPQAQDETTTTTTATSARTANTHVLAGLYYQTLRTSASSPSNLSTATPTPNEPGRGCDGACCSSGARHYNATQGKQQPQPQRLACASNEANSRLLASFLRSKQEQHGLDAHRKQKEQQQQQQVTARCRDHNKTANHSGKRHSLINLLTHTGHRTQARRSFAAFGMGVLNNSNTAGRHRTGRRLTSGGELLSAHLGLRNQEPPQPMQGSAQSLDGQQPPIQYDPLIPESGFKIVVMGTSGSGKTSIIQRFLYGTFSARHLPTVEDTYFIEFPYKKNLINISVSDTSGTYQFPAMRKLAINSGDAFILVYSVDDPQSFDCLEQLRQTILEEREQAYLESVVAACPSDSSSSSTSSLAPPAHHQAGPAAAASGGGVQGPATMMSSLTSTVMNHDKHHAHQRAEHHNHHHHHHQQQQHHHNQLQPAPSAHDLSPARHWSLASLFSHHHHHQQQQPREQSGNTNQQFHHHSSIGSSICSSSSCSSAENSRRSSISAAEAALRTRRTRKPPMVIVANKHDLPKDKHLINSDEIEALAVIDWNNGFVRASAALNWNIEEIFQQVLTQARQPPTLSEAIVSKRRKSLPPKLPHP